jgi:hypothetical protein
VRHRFVRSPVAALVSVVTLALLPAASAGNRRVAQIQIVKHARLSPDGFVRLEVKYVCYPFSGQEGRLFGFVEQGGTFANVINGATCDGREHRTTIFGLGPGFSPGLASASAGVEDDGSDAQAEANIKIK